MENAKLPLIGLGTYKLRGNECERVVQEALEIGYRHFDTADVYENHPEIGRAVQGFSRGDIFIVSKLYVNDLVPSRVRKAAVRFLDELQMEYLDLLLIHWPNPDVNLIDTLYAMDEIRKEGLIRNMGISNFVGFHLDALAAHHFPILTNQIEMHPYFQRRTLVKKCQELGIQITAYRPLAKGAFEKDAALAGIGAQYGKTGSQVALRWMVQQGIAVIPKAASTEHLKENFNIFDFSLSAEDMAAIDQLDSGKRYCAPEGLPVYND